MPAMSAISAGSIHHGPDESSTGPSAATLAMTRSDPHGLPRLRLSGWSVMYAQTFGATMRESISTAMSVPISTGVKPIDLRYRPQYGTSAPSTEKEKKKKQARRQYGMTPITFAGAPGA